MLIHSSVSPLTPSKYHSSSNCCRDACSQLCKSGSCGEGCSDSSKLASIVIKDGDELRPGAELIPRCLCKAVINGLECIIAKSIGYLRCTVRTLDQRDLIMPFFNQIIRATHRLPYPGKALGQKPAALSARKAKVYIPTRPFS